MPPLKDKKLKTEYVPLKFSKLLPMVVKQGKFLNAYFFCFFNSFSPKADQHQCLNLNSSSVLIFNLCCSMGCDGRQNARRRVRFDKIFASFSLIGKGRANPA